MDTPENLRLASALSDGQAAELAALGARIESHYGVPQDIEWGLVNDNLYLLQARPITTLAPPEKVHDVEGEYSRVMMVEIFPDALRWLWRDYPGVKGADDAPDLDMITGVWDVETNEKMDKDRFRRDLGGLVEAYQEVARRLGILNENDPVTPVKPKLVKS